MIEPGNACTATSSVEVALSGGNTVVVEAASAAF
jgi:hypothetical protein